LTTPARIDLLLGGTRRVRRATPGLAAVSCLLTELGPADRVAHAGRGDLGGPLR
jgi:hypothetical protein